MICPLLSALRKQKCVEANCRFWTHLQGQHPQTGEKIDRLGCAFEFLPLLLVEASQMTRQAAAAAGQMANQVNLVAQMAGIFGVGAKKGDVNAPALPGK